MQLPYQPGVDHLMPGTINGISPLIWLQFNENAGDSTLVNAGSLGSAGNWTIGAGVALGEKGRFGGQIRLLGDTTAYIRSSAGVAEPTSGCSVWMWVQVETYGSTWGTFLHKAQSPTAWSSPFTCFSLVHDVAATGVISSGVCISGSTSGITTTLPRKTILNEWVHLCSTHDSTTFKFYLNGMLAASASRVGSIDWRSHGRWFAGNHDPALTGAANEPVKGLMADLRIYDGALPASAPLAAYRRGMDVNP